MIDISIVPDGLFYRAVKNKDIISVTILDDKEHSAYKNNKIYDNNKEILVHNKYNSYFISRDELVKNYRNLDGTKIRLSGWHYRTKYNLYREVREDIAILRINSSLLKMTNINNKNSLLVCRVINNKIDKSSYYIVNSKDDLEIFRKSVSLLKKPDVKLAKRELADRVRVKELQSEVDINNTKTYRNPILEKQDNNELLVGAPYTVTMRLLKKNNIGKTVRVGFRVKRKKDNIEKDCNFDRVKNMCLAKEIDNLTIAVMENGTEYFRGINIKIENLPSKYV